MNVDIVETDTQNKLTVPAGELKPYPLSQNDKPVEASSVEVPTQEPVVTDAQQETSDIIQEAAASQPEPLDQPAEELKQEPAQEKAQLNPVQKQEQEQEVYVREDSPEEQLARKMGKGNSKENVFFEPETGTNIITNTDDYDKARFEYLRGAMKTAYLKRTHNYADMDENLYEAGNTMLHTIGKALGGFTTDLLTSSASAASVSGAAVTGTAKSMANNISDWFANSFKMAFLMNKSDFSDYNQRQMDKILSNPIFGQLKANGASPETIKAEADKIYDFPEKYKISNIIAEKAGVLQQELSNPQAMFAKDIEAAKTIYSEFRALNSKIKEEFNLNPDQYDDPTVVYWGNVLSSTLLCAAGAFSGGMGWLMPAMYAAMEWDDAMAEGLQNGKSFEELLPKSNLVAATSLVTERLQILSAVKRYKGMRQMMTKGMAAWAFENTAQEVLQDTSIMATKQATGITDYTTMDYLAMIPETALAALVSSVPMGVIIQHNKIRLAKSYMAAGVSEERALTMADFVMEQGLDAVNENPTILKEFAESLNDILKTSKVIFARNAIEESRAEMDNNAAIEQRATDYAATEKQNGGLVGVLNTNVANAVADSMVGFTSKINSQEQDAQQENRYGMGSLFTLNKQFNLIRYGKALAEKVKRVGTASILTVRLPERSQIAESNLPIKLQSQEIQDSFHKVYNVLPENARKVIKSFADMKEMTPNRLYNAIANMVPGRQKGLTQILVNNGIKGVIVESKNPTHISAIVFDDKKDVAIVKSEPISMGKQELAQPFAKMTKEQLDNMNLEQFLELTKASRLFKEPKNGKFSGLANPDYVVNAAVSQLVGTSLFTEQEARIIASQLVGLQYVNGVMFGDGAASTKTILETLPTFANTYMSSAFNKNGEYEDFWRLAVPEDSIFNYNRGTQTYPKINEKLLKKIFGKTDVTENDLKAFATIVRRVLTGDSYSGKWQDGYNFLKEEFNKKTVFGDEDNPAFASVLRTLIAFETRLQESSSNSHSFGPDLKVTEPVVYKYQGKEKIAHMTDLAILRVFGLWQADKTDSTGFWNPNRNSDILEDFYRNQYRQTGINVTKDIPLRELYNRTFNDDLPQGETAAWRITKAMFELNRGGALVRNGDYDAIFFSFASRPVTAIHEAGHEVLYIALDVFNRYKLFQPQKAKRIIKSFEKVYEKNYGEKINFSEPLSKEQEEKAQELFAQLYARSFIDGRATDTDNDVNEAVKIIENVHSLIRNPSVDQNFASIDRIKTEDAYNEWQNTWNELNRKETAPALLEARQKLLLGYDKIVGMNQSLQEGIGQAVEELNKLPSSPVTMVAKYQLKRALDSGNLAYVLQANATLVNGAVEELFGVKLLNQTLIDAMRNDSDRSSTESLCKMACAVWEPLKQVLPENVAKSLEKMYVAGSKYYDEANNAIARAVNEDGYVKSFVNFARKALQPISRTAKQLSPKLHYMLRKAVYVENRVKAAFSLNMNQFFSVYDQMEEVDQQVMDAALFDQDWRAVEDIFARYGDINIVRGIKSDLDAAYSMLEEADPDENGIRITKNYFPRSVKHMDEMLQYMINKPEYKMMAEQIMQQKALGEEAATIIAQKYGDVGKIEQGKNRHALERSFVKVPEDLRQFYATPREALQKYYDDVAAVYGNFTFFGKGANKKMRPNAKGEVVLDYVDLKTGRKEQVTFYAYEPTVAWEKNLEKSGFFKEPKTQADREYNKKVAEVIEGIFFRKSPHPFVTVYRTVNNIATINNFFAAMSNLVDFAITTWRYGFRNTLEGAAIAAKGESGVEYKELLTDLYAEFDMDSYKLNRIFNKVFTWSGFSMLDLFGKQSSINAALGSAREKLLKGDQAIIDKIAMYMGDDQNLTSAVIADIMDGKITDDVKFFLFNELSGQQPLTLLDVPYYYNLHPNMRVFYQFKTFMLRQADFFVHDVLMKKMKEKPLDALKDAVRFMALLAIFGVPKELIKAIFNGQAFDLSDEVVSQLLGVGLINKYSYYNFKDGHIVKGAGAMIIPPMPVVSRLWNDAKGLTIGKKVGKKGRKRINLTEIESVKDIPSVGPLGGETLYWWLGGGSDRHFTASL